MSHVCTSRFSHGTWEEERGETCVIIRNCLYPSLPQVEGKHLEFAHILDFYPVMNWTTSLTMPILN